MKTTARIILLAMTLFLLAACQQTAEPEATVELAGTNWILSSLNGELPLAGTAVTLQFGTDGSVFGTDGCNRYNTTYTQEGSSLTINQSTGISTMMACAEPEGIIEQEQEYLAALGTAATYQITGDRLEMRTADNATVATFERGTP